MADSEAMRRLGDQLFSRTAGAPLVRGNAVRLLRDAVDNYPAWLDAIRKARRSVHFENYIVHDDVVGQRFATAFLDKARDGVAVRVVYDWFGSLGKASLARRTLWLTDAYFAGTCTYVQALRAAAQDGVDVRLLVPGAASDVPMMQSVSRAGYRALLEAGVRIFEWNGPMLHAKTAVADAHWARVGSTNLNLSSWVGNRELDVVVEDEAFGRRMEEMFQDDLGNATEIVSRRWARVRPAGDARVPRVRGAGASATRAAAGALRIGNALGSALAARRVHGPAERWLMAEGGLLLTVVAVVGFVWPRLLAWPLAALSLWLGLALIVRAARRKAATLSPRPHAVAGTPPQLQ